MRKNYANSSLTRPDVAVEAVDFKTANNSYNGIYLSTSDKKSFDFSERPSRLLDRVYL